MVDDVTEPQQHQNPQQVTTLGFSLNELKEMSAASRRVFLSQVCESPNLSRNKKPLLALRLSSSPHESAEVGAQG